jgi:thioredoxin 1
MTTVHHVNDDTFDTSLPTEGIAIVDLSASWCGPCKAYAPIIENSASRHPDIKHLAIDVDESPRIAQRFEVMSVPTTIFFRDGILVGGFPGLLNAHRLDDLINQTQNLDMDHVRSALNADR